MTKTSTEIVPTILGNLYKNAILRVRNKDWIGHVTPKQGDIFYRYYPSKDQLNYKRETVTLEKEDFIVPVKFNNIIGIGKNYSLREKKEDVKNFKMNPDFFLMSSNSILSNYKTAYLPYYYDSVLIEPEIGVIINKKCKNIKFQNVKDHIAGYIICNDLSGRDLKNLNNDNALLRKSSDGFLPVSSAMIPYPGKEHFILKTYVNGKLVQLFNTKDLILQINDAISFLSTHITLYKNDLICTGTALPKLKVKSEDKVEIYVDGMGSLNTIFK